MSSCTSCGHQLGVGRFCTNCGALVDPSTPDGSPVSSPAPPTTVLAPPTDSGPGPGREPAPDWRTDTAERPAVPRVAPDPRTPPAAVAPPPPPRYPLFADEVPAYTADGPVTVPAGTPVVAAAPTPDATYLPEPEPEADDASFFGLGADPEQGPDAAYSYVEDRRSPVLWILVAALVLVLLAAGWWFFVRDDGSAARDDGAGPGSAAASTGVDVAARASAKAPKTAPPNEDVNGDQVSYDASNMLDGVPETAWRTPGDASGMKLTFTLREPTVLQQVGLVNGYAKTSTDAKNRTFDWYRGNRRITEVLWVFDDGTKVRQKLSETRDLQTVEVDDVTTRTVVLKLVSVTPPGQGTASRDFTAISEVSLVAAPQG